MENKNTEDEETIKDDEGQVEISTDKTPNVKSPRWKSPRLKSLYQNFFVGIISAVFAGLIVWQIQAREYQNREVDKKTNLIHTIEESILNECERLQDTFSILYRDYPTLTCEINAYRIPQPDPALADYMNSKRDIVVEQMGKVGADIIRNFTLSSKAYDRIFNAKYFKSTFYRGTSTFHDYFDPLESACKQFGVELKIQECPY